MKNKRNMKKWIALGLVAALGASITGCSMTKSNKMMDTKLKKI
ncbi:hypothetical protein [Clostridium beijerinckii]|nr:hypothetical protein [Clostridium beijerinckii]